MMKVKLLNEREIYRVIKEKWKKIEDGIDDGTFQYELIIAEIDSIINRRKILLKNHPHLRQKFGDDFRTSRDMHTARKLWYNKRRIHHETQIAWWKENVKILNSTSEKVGMSGLAILLTIHGAIAIGSMKIITEGKDGIYLLLMSKIGLFFSIIGISTLVAGKAMLFHSISRNSGDINSLLVTAVDQNNLKKMYEINSYSVSKNISALYVIYSSVVSLIVCLIMIFLISISVRW